MSKKKSATPVVAATAPPTTPSMPSAPCASTAPKVSASTWAWLIGVLILVITLAIVSPSGCQSKPKTPQKILGPLKETEEVEFKLEKKDDLVRLETKGRKFTIEWIEPKKADENLLEYMAHGKMGMHGGDIVSSAWVRPPFQFPPTGIEHDIGWISFRLDEGNGPIIGKVHFFEREMIQIKP